mgnify:CR=1 FL=1
MNGCPTLRQFERTLDASRSLYAQLLKLRRMTECCRSCKHDGRCPARGELERKIELALAQVNQEFGICRYSHSGTERQQ